MARRTKKVGPAGRYQARYGVRARTQVRNIEIYQRAKHICPSCGHKRVKRVSTGIWQCKKCETKFAGGAYLPKTEPGQNVERIMKGEISGLELIKIATEENKEEVEK